nr:Hsp20/alpha crystallin family protein [Anaerolineae bacterium]
MAMTKVNPNRDYMTMRDFMNRFFEDTLDYSGGNRVARLPLDAYTTENEIVVTASIPGAIPDEVEITIEGDSLTIRGEIAPRLENASYIFSERFHGQFSRTLQLNVPIDQEHIEATFENGILTLVLPKTEEVRPKVIKVQAK